MSDFAFKGFEPANTIPVPDALFDELLPHLNEAQLKVMLYIIRRTLGFKKTADAISLKQFRWGITTKDGKKLDEGCGLKNFTTITKALRELEQMNCIESNKRETDIGDQDTTVYCIRFRGTTQTVVPTTHNVVPTTANRAGVLRQTYDGTTPNVEGVLRQTYPQETVLQETELQERVIPEESNSAHTDTFAPSLPLGALSLSQSIDTESHSQENLPLSSAVTTRNEEGAPDHAQPLQPLQPLPTANHSDRGSGDVPSRDSQVDSTGFTSPLDAPPVGSAAGSDAVGRERRAGVGEDTARGIGSRSPGEADATGDTARGQVTEGCDHAHLPAGSARGNGALPGAGGDSHDAPVDDRHVVAPETGPGVATGQERTAVDDLVGMDTAGTFGRSGAGSVLDRVWAGVRADAVRGDEQERAGRIEQIAPREDVPVVAASPLDTSTVEPGESEKGTLPVAPVTPAQGMDEKPKTPAPLSEPDMSGKWSNEKCVQYAEWCNDKRYTDKMREEQLKAAASIHKNDACLTLDEFKQAYDERNDDWWLEHKKKLHVSDMKAKGKSGIDRVHEMLQHIEDRTTRGNKSKRHLRIVSTNAQPDDENMIEWKGQWMPKEEAYQQGYLGGWERYKGQLLPDGRHPLDDELPMQGVK